MSFLETTEIVDSARGCVARAVNAAMVEAYWEIGRKIVEVEQAGERRADYGAQLIERLSQRMTERFKTGFSIRNLERMRQFYLVFEDRTTAIDPRNDAVDNDVQLLRPLLLRNRSRHRGLVEPRTRTPDRLTSI